MAAQQSSQLVHSYPVLLMNKRQLVQALNVAFLGELKQNLVERLHEFTDCAYTKHEHRQSIVSLLSCIKFQLHKLVKLIYRLRRRMASPNEPQQLGQVRQLARQLVEFCAELDYQLQMVAIEQSDELDRSNTELDRSSAELELTKQMKHHCLVGDATKARRCFSQFLEHSEQLVETCKMLNQIAPTNKLKITTKSLATWFQMNCKQLVSMAGSLSERPRSKVLKDCVWTYIQVWCSFYDDFCQLARQVAYLARAKCDQARGQRVSSLREQICLARSGQLLSETTPTNPRGDLLMMEQEARQWRLNSPYSLGSAQSLNTSMLHTSACGFSLQGDRGGAMAPGQPPNDSPRSLDHYHGFGPNYRRWHDHHRAHYEPAALNGERVQAQTSGSQATCSSSSLMPLSPSPTQFTPYAQPVTSRHDRATAEEFESHLLQLQYEHQAQLQPAEGCTQPPPPPPPPLASEFLTSESAQWGALVDTAHEGWNAEASNLYLGARGDCAFSSSALPEAPCQLAPMAPTSIPENPTAPSIEPPIVPARRPTNLGPLAADYQQPTSSGRASRAPPPPPLQLQESNYDDDDHHHHHHHHHDQEAIRRDLGAQTASRRRNQVGRQVSTANPTRSNRPSGHQHIQEADRPEIVPSHRVQAADQQSIASSNLDGTQTTTATEKWSDSEADAIVRGARETAQMALSMYQFTRGEGDLNTTQDLFTQAELFAEEANELYKEVRCFSYKVPAGDLKKELLFQLSTIPALVQQLQFTVKNPTVGKAATFAKVDSVIRETKCLMEAVNRVVEATLSCRQHYNMASSSVRKRTRTLSPTYRGDKFEFDSFGSPGGGRSLGGAFGGPGGRHASGASGGMGSEPDI